MKNLIAHIKYRPRYRPFHDIFMCIPRKFYECFTYCSSYYLSKIRMESTEWCSNWFLIKNFLLSLISSTGTNIDWGAVKMSHISSPKTTEFFQLWYEKHEPALFTTLLDWSFFKWCGNNNEYLKKKQTSLQWHNQQHICLFLIWFVLVPCVVESQ